MKYHQVAVKIAVLLILATTGTQSQSNSIHIEWAATIREHGSWSVPGYYYPGFSSFVTPISTTFNDSEVEVRPNFSNTTLTVFGGAKLTVISTSILSILPGSNGGTNWIPQIRDTYIHISNEVNGSHYAEFGSRISDSAILNDGSILSQTFFVVQRGYISGLLADAFRQPAAAGSALQILLQSNSFFGPAQVTSSWTNYVNGSAAAGEGYYGSAALVSTAILPVPEPASAILLLAGIVAVVFVSRRVRH